MNAATKMNFILVKNPSIVRRLQPSITQASIHVTVLSNRSAVGPSRLRQNLVLRAFFSTDTSNASSSFTMKNSPRLSNRKSLHDDQPSFKVAKVTHAGEIAKTNLKIGELLKAASILPRDLFTLNLTSRKERRLYPMRLVRRSPPAIETRDKIIILSFGNIRAVVGLDGVFLLDAHNPSVMEFAKDVAENFRSDKKNHAEPPELVFLEHVLRDTVDSFQRRLRLYEPIIDSFLDRVANEVYSDTGVHQLVPLKDSLQSFEIQVKQCLECLTALLTDDEQMLDLLLTEQAEAAETGRPVEFERHEHVELLLGVYARQLSNISMEIIYSLGRLQSKQEFVALALAGYRNRMIRMNVHLSIAALTLALGTSVAGFYGMNVINGFEDSTLAFNYIVSGSGVAGLVVALGSLNYLSGSAMQKRASQRLKENETLTSALADLCAVDYALKSTVERGEVINRDRFRRTLLLAKPSKRVTEEEVDLLFNVFDRLKDGNLTSDDFYITNGDTSAKSKVGVDEIGSTP